MQSFAQGRFHRRFYGFWAVSKNRCFFDRVKGRQKIAKIEPWSEKGSPRWLRQSSGAKFLGQRGPYTVRKKDRFDSKTIQKGSRHARRPKAWRIFYLYLYIYIYIYVYIYIYILIVLISVDIHWCLATFVHICQSCWCVLIVVIFVDSR